jgi:hypothetical protein
MLLWVLRILLLLRYFFVLSWGRWKARVVLWNIRLWGKIVERRFELVQYLEQVKHGVWDAFLHSCKAPQFYLPRPQKLIVYEVSSRICHCIVFHGAITYHFHILSWDKRIQRSTYELEMGYENRRRKCRKSIDELGSTTPWQVSFEKWNSGTWWGKVTTWAFNSP